ncbi:MAG: hypothetical protein PHI71_10020 [Acidiphilium sp.]|nr:hypothetical protein [Acidiphilium sp.]
MRLAKYGFTVSMLGLGLGLIGSPAISSAANWVKLQDVSPASAPAVHISGFIEPIYSSTSDTATINGATPNENLIGPGLNSSSDFNILRARLMVRGYINRYFSYFFAGEFGNNSFSNPGTGYAPRLQDGHVTLSYLPGVRVTAGIIRAPGPENAMQGYMAYDFTAFPAVIQQLMFQTFYNPRPTKGYVASAGGYLVPESGVQGTNAFRYTGIAAEDWFRNGPWEFTYDTMLGSFAPLTAIGQPGDGPIFAARLQESYIFGGHGPYRSDLTGFVWAQYAHPQFDNRFYALSRQGLGVTYMQNEFHTGGRWFKAEYMQGSGMIDTSPAFGIQLATIRSPTLTQAQVYPGIGNRAYGYYVGAGVFVTPKLELDLRYDYYNRLPNNHAQNRVFHTVTAGIQYHLAPLDKIMVDYAIRSLDVPYPTAAPPASRPIVASISRSIDNQITAELVLSF